MKIIHANLLAIMFACTVTVGVFCFCVQMFCIVIQEEISLKPFKLQDLPQESRNSFVPSHNKTNKENSHRQAWPHQTLKEMKSRKPMKKQNALLENLGSLSTRTESNITTIKNCSLRNEDSPVRDHSLKEVKKMALSKSKNVHLNIQNLRSSDVQNHVSGESEQIFFGNSRNIAQEKNLCKDSDSTKKQNEILEESGQPQSTRSTATVGSKSKVTSKKPPTKPLHLGKLVYFIYI